MRNLFDDFLEELRKREALARGEDPGTGAPRGTPPDDPDDARDDAETEAERAWRQTAKAMSMAMQFAWLRRGELLGLRWRDVELSRPTGPRNALGPAVLELDDLWADADRGGDAVRGVTLAQVAQHQHARQDLGEGVHLVHARVLGRAAMGRLEDGDAFADVGAGGHAETAD